MRDQGINLSVGGVGIDGMIEGQIAPEHLLIQVGECLKLVGLRPQVLKIESQINVKTLPFQNYLLNLQAD